MKKLSAYLLFSLLYISVVHAQTTFQQIFGGPNQSSSSGVSVQQTKDNGYIIAGIATNFISGAGDDVYLFKLDASGNLAWSRTYGTANSEETYSVAQTADGGYILSGYCSNPQHGFLIKTDDKGDTTWTKTYGSSSAQFFDAEQTTDGGYIAAGRDQAGSIYSGCLTKIDNYGNVTWNKIYGASLSTFDFQSVVQNSDGSYTACGALNEYPVSSCYVIKVNSAGDTLWSRTYSCATATAIVKCASGGYLVGGKNYSSTSSENGGYLIRIDAGGKVIWSKEYDVSYAVTSIQPIADSGYDVLFTNYTGAEAAVVLRLDTSGNVLWDKTYQPSNGTVTAQNIASTTDGGCIFVGADGSDVYAVRTNVNGQSNCNEATNLFTPISPGTLSSLFHQYNIYDGTSTTGYTPFFVDSNLTTTTVLCSTPVAVPEIENISSSTLFPNPFSESATISLSNNAGNTEFEIDIYNVQGEEVKRISHITTETFTIEKDNINNGLYFYKLIGNNGFITTGKFIIE